MSIRSTWNSFRFFTKKKSPEIFIGLGIAGFGATVYLACKATIKAQEVKKEKDKTLSIIAECEESGMIDENQEYSAEDAKRDRKIVTTKATLQYVKLYLPAFGVGILSIGSILWGHRVLKKRYLNLGAAYTALDKAYKEYQKRVENEVGPETEKRIRYGYGAEDKPGKDDEIDARPLDPKKQLECSPYARFFDESCNGWDGNNPQNSIYFLRNQERYFDNLLKRRGYVTLNEVYDAFGIQKIKEGQTIGWLLDKKLLKTNPDKRQIDFGIYEGRSPRDRAFVNGYENVFLMDFNITGDILGAFSA